ncbi:serine carboxypeptidase-like 40 [Euphorbia peplus]|nr:serine carboxypeptidase-like 40 [Euphorbia peplus]
MGNFNYLQACLVVAFFLIISGCAAQKMHPKIRQSDALMDKLYKDLSEFETFKVDNWDQEEEMEEIVDGNVRKSELEGSKEDDKIVQLPGQPQVNFSQYGGYVTVDEVAGRSLFYYFVEADQPSSQSLPLLLWLNGGPGCSSVGFGAMEELGPFRINGDGKTLYRNKYSWNNVANVIFLETPAGVGFSYSNRTSDYTTIGDRQTAKDNYKFLVKWLERFPEYKEREFYIAGESYAGNFVPQFAHNILSGNNKPGNPHINLKGIAIGNAVIDWETIHLGIYDYYGSHALISPQTSERIRNNCSFPTQLGQRNSSKECNLALEQAILDTKVINTYNIYTPLCPYVDLTSKPENASVTNFDPCRDYVFEYLNRAQVQEAMHANVTKLDHNWKPCSRLISWNDRSISSLSLLQEFMDKGLRVLVYSGDVDGVVPVTSTQYALKKLNLKTEIEWYPWFVDGQVGGYTEVYQGNLTFATVRGAGHEVPFYQPERSLTMIKNFLSGKNLPKISNMPS